MADIITTEFHQITLDEYLNAKQEIANILKNIANDYVGVGYRLRRIRDSEAYRQEGYESIWDFAKKEYGLGESTVSRFMAINSRFSEGGYSDRLIPEYRNYGSGKLSEMLSLPDKDCELITETTTVASIREIKKYNKEEKAYIEEQEKKAEDSNEQNAAPAENSNEEHIEKVQAEIVRTQSATYSDFEKVIIEFFRNEPELLNEIYRMSDYEQIVEAINPSGSRTFKKKIYMLFMYEYAGGLVLKKMGAPNTNYSWEEFIETTVSIYRDTYTDHDSVWQNYYGEEIETKEEKGDTGNMVTPSEQKADEGTKKTEAKDHKRDDKSNENKTDVKSEENNKNTHTDNEMTRDDNKTIENNNKKEILTDITDNTDENMAGKTEKTSDNTVLATSQENETDIEKEPKWLTVNDWYKKEYNTSLLADIREEIESHTTEPADDELVEELGRLMTHIAGMYAEYMLNMTHNEECREENNENEQIPGQANIEDYIEEA